MSLDLRSQTTIERKWREARDEREFAARRRQDAERARRECWVKLREMERLDKKATAADNHADQLERERQIVLERISGYQRHIDGCESEMRDCERRIDEYRQRVRGQQQVIRDRRAEAQNLTREADQARRAADSAAIRGTADRAMGNAGSRALLEEAERKQREAMRKESEAQDLEGLAQDGERDIVRLCDKMLVNGRRRADVQREKEREEGRVAELAVDLQRYKREKENCRTAARELREEEKRYDEEELRATEEAERAERQAELADEEAARLEREVGPFLCVGANR